jgi:uncharacterized membrane protein YidH (DUF202 family)
MKTKLFIFIASLLAPSFVLAAQPPETINQIFGVFGKGNLEGLIPVLILVAVVTFMAGIVKFVGAGDNQEKRQAGREVMIWGIIVLFVMVSLWGFVGIMTRTFFGKSYGLPNYLPALQK